MQINLLELNYKDEINIDQEVSYSEEFIKSSDILKLSDVHVKGKITRNLDDEYVISFNLVGEMTIHDSNTYDEIPYKFNVLIEENLESSMKTLDLNEFLWHYIVLEVPIKYTLNENYHQKGDGYEVISEEEYENKEGNNPFKDFHLE